MSIFMMIHTCQFIGLVYWALAHVVLVVQVTIHLIMATLLDVGRMLPHTSEFVYMETFDLMGVF